MSNIKQCQSWQHVLRQNFTQWNLLADFLELTQDQQKSILAKPQFSLNLPLRLAQKITKGTLDDPILRQFLPTEQEVQITEGFEQDPVGDQSCRKASKLLHKYEGRVLLVCTSACAMHCRYCFRQNFEYDVVDKTYSQEIEMISQDTSLHEVILSGGDPLSLPDRILKNLLESISAIPHIRRVRFHTRFPIGIPERIDSEFLAIIKAIPQQILFVIHANHAFELDADVLAGLKELQKLGVVVLNQAVLLHGVNDTIESQKDLCERLVDHGILPYYLHQLDRVQGAAHFEVPESEGRLLIEALKQQLPGYAIPKYVREIAGKPSKTSLLE